MPQKKTTQAVIKHARLNPVTSIEDKKALEIIAELEAEGYNFKQIAVDAILRAGGAKPEMFARTSNGDLMSGMEDMLSRFADEILSKIQISGGRINEESSDDQESPFSRNFAKSFMQRQQRAMGDEE